MRVLGIVPARAGSKRLPGKNRLELGGQPLWLLAVEQALLAGCDWVVVSTDDPVILGQDRWLHGPVGMRERPRLLALDTTPVEAVVRHVLETETAGPFDAVCLLNPTHPLRLIEDIRDCIEDVTQRGFPSSTLCWKDYGYTLPEGAALKTMNAQDRIPRIVVSGECYVARVPAFIEFGSLMVYGNINRGHARLSGGPRVDIDTQDDFAVAKALYYSKLSKVMEGA